MTDPTGRTKSAILGLTPCLFTLVRLIGKVSSEEQVPAAKIAVGR
jgi:hypothetical protein